MLHILSGGYLPSCIGSEVGLIPRSFLPISNTRLLYHQIRLFRKAHPDIQISVSLPNSYDLPEKDLETLANYNAEIFLVDSDLDLKSELLHVLRDIPFGALWCLDGSCLPVEVPVGKDLVALEWSSIESDRHIEEYGIEENLVHFGMYKFADSQLLLDCASSNDIDFYSLIKQYSLNTGAQNIVIDSGHYLGNIAGYYKARSKITSERAFNSLEVVDTVLHKSSIHSDKILAESNWFKKVPNSLKKYIPQYISSQIKDGRYTYSIEFLPLLPLNELYVYGRHTVVFWNMVFSRILKYFDQSKISYQDSEIESVPESSCNRSLLVEKTRERILEFSSKSGFDLDSENVHCGEKVPSVNRMILDLEVCVSNIPDQIGFVHGDLCFSNILFDSRAEGIKLIDPRGVDGDGQEMIFGSVVYDIAKLSHSVLGLYDYIIANQYRLDGEGNTFDFEIFTPQGLDEVQLLFIQKISHLKISKHDVYAMSALLFLSMLPLHYDDAKRQRALLANAMRLYKRLSY